MPKNSQQRKAAWMSLQNEGDFKHNSTVYKSGVGEIIPKWRSKKKAHSPSKFVPCPTCKAINMKRRLYAHSRKCKSAGRCSKRPTSMAMLMLPVPNNMSKAFLHNVVYKMVDDKESECVRNDTLILKFGEIKYNKKDVAEHTANNVSSGMRLLARLVLKVRQLSGNSISKLSEIITCSNFDMLVSAVKDLSMYEENSNQYKKGSVALKLGYSIKKCAEIMQVEANKKDDSITAKRCKTFLSVFNSSWSDMISSSANQSLEIAKFNKLPLLPTCKDVHILYSFVKQRSKVASDY